MKLDRDLKAGDRHYRAYVGPPDRYDLLAAQQFALVTLLGLREDDRLLDLGCGSLRAGRLFLPYLRPERYFGIEPNGWLVEEGFAHEAGEDVRRLKRPRFAHNDDFDLGIFGVAFDYILAQSIFSHTGPATLRRGVASAAEWLRPDGLLVATFVEGKTDDARAEWVYPGLTYFRWETVAAACEAHGLCAAKVDWPHPMQTWFVAAPDEGRLARAGEVVDFVPAEINLTPLKQSAHRAGGSFGFLRPRNAGGGASPQDAGAAPRRPAA